MDDDSYIIKDTIDVNVNSLESPQIIQLIKIILNIKCKAFMQQMFCMVIYRYAKLIKQKL